jgi:NACHT domain- and WD repeat-containing protein
VTVTRGCVGVWEIKTGRLLTKLADSILGAIVTHAVITPDSRNIISSETGKILVWNRVTEQVLSKDDQPGCQQITLLDNGDRFLTISCANLNGAVAMAADDEQQRFTALAIVRVIPGE